MNKSLITQNVVGAALFMFGTILLWYANEYGFGNFAAFLGSVVGQTSIFLLITLLILAATPLRKKVTILFLFGLIWFASAGYKSLELYEIGVEERELASSAAGLYKNFLSGKKIDTSEIDGLESS